MGTPWDRAAERYLEQWVPRFVPYHIDLVGELVLRPGQRVLVVSAGPGAEVLAVARSVGESGHVRATDANPEMVRLCREQAERAGFASVACVEASPHDTGDGSWDAILCAFGLWRMADRPGVLRAWGSALAPHGKVGILTLGAAEQGDPFEELSLALGELEPSAVARPARFIAGREDLATMFEESGLSLVRHTVLRHTVSFPTAEGFAAAIGEGRTWRPVWDELGSERMGRVLARFYDRVGGPATPLTFEPAVTLAVAALPGAEVELAHRPHSVKVPPISSSRPGER